MDRSDARDTLLFGCVLAAMVVALEGGFRALRSVDAMLAGIGTLPGFAAQCLSLVLHLGLIGGVLSVVERLLPGSGVPARRAQAFWFWIWYVPVAVFSAQVVQGLLARYGVGPLWTIRLEAFGWTGPWRVVGAALLAFAAIVVLDFFFYWFHRLQHRVPLLWAFHRAHHANRSINAIGSYHHPLEEAWRIPFMTLPLALALQFDAPRLALVSAFLSSWAFINHMDTRLHFGPLRHVFADPRYHRVHHSMAPEHHGSNFAGLFSPWDRLFGTQTMPPPDAHRLAVGLDDMPHPRSTGDFLLAPWRDLSGRRSGAR